MYLYHRDFQIILSIHSGVFMYLAILTVLFLFFRYHLSMKNIIIIWAGAAGLMAAATIQEDSSPEKTEFHIHLFEKNTSPGKKVIISWWGRCNVTTSIEDKKILATKYTRGWEFIRKSMGKFSPRKCREWFESHGVPLKIQEDLRVFPVSDDGRDVVGVFEDIFAKNRDMITLHYGEWVSEVSVISTESPVPMVTTRNPAQKLTHSEQDFSIPLPLHSKWQEQNHIIGWESDSSVSLRNDKSELWNPKYQIITPKWYYTADILIITTGWNAYSHTGSTGDGYAFARSLGHSVTELWPSLSSFLTREKWLHELSGLAFEDARIVIPAHAGILWFKKDSAPSVEWRDQEPRTQNQELSWPLLLTHFGISGPLAFMLSSQLAFERIEKWSPRTISFCPLSSLKFSDWEAFLKDQFQNHPKKLITSILSEKLPRRFAEAFIQEYFPHIESTFAGSIARADREKISRFLGDGIPLTLLERRPWDEFVTAGWVDTDELDPETMESRIQENLYFAGEVLNVDGYTGGFSLQICWASGRAVGMDTSEKLAQEKKTI